MSSPARTRTSRALLVLAGVLGVLAIVPSLRGVSERSEVPAAASGEVALPLPSIGDANAARARLASVQDDSLRTDEAIATGAARTIVGERIEVRVIGASGESALVESWFKGRSAAAFRHASHETDGEGRLEL